MRDEDITAYAVAAGRGEQEALAAFVRATQVDVWRFVAYLAGRAVADDLTHETYLRAMRGLRTFRGDTVARVWLLTIARRTVVDHFHRQARRPPVTASLDAVVGAELADPVLADPPGAVDLRSLIERLDPDKRSAFALTQISGLSYAAAAEVCAVRVGTIRSRVADARQDLMDWIAESECESECQSEAGAGADLTEPPCTRRRRGLR